MSPTKPSSLLPLPATTYTPPSANRSKASTLEQNVASVPKMAQYYREVHDITCELLEALQQGDPFQNQKASKIILRLVLWISTSLAIIDTLAIGGAQIPSPATLATGPTTSLPPGLIAHVVVPTESGGWWQLTVA